MAPREWSTCDIPEDAIATDSGVDDNPRMIGRMRNHAASVLMLCLTLAGCGYAEWPPRSRGPVDVNRAPAPQTRQEPVAVQETAPQIPSSFRNATAVIVGDGDTVYALSRRHSVSTRAIIDANELAPPFHLIVGQRIVLPRYPEYQVARGDTLTAIATRYDVGIYEMARLNDLEPPYKIFVGQKLRLPKADEKANQTATSTSKPPPNRTANRDVDSRTKTETTVKHAPSVASSTPTSPPPSPPRQVALRSVPAPPPITGEGFLWPVKGPILSSFGAKAKGFHNDGINIAAKRGTPVRAAENGVVVYAGNELRGFGNLLLVKHTDGWVTAYAHAEKLLVARGDRVTKGQSIATVGATGNVTRPQLHFEIRKGKRARDPRKHLRRA